MSGEEQVAGGSKKMKPLYKSTKESAEVPAPVVSELAKIQRIFRKGSSTSKALEQTYLFSEGLMYKDPEEED